jgi:selenide,water dikinase
LSPGDLDRALAGISKQSIENVMVGFDQADDGGVYRLSEALALVQTVDFFAPIVDDPWAYGQIAAANAVNDIFAMGGRPITALSIVGFPAGRLGPEVLDSIMDGGLRKLDEVGVALLGGHSVKDEEVKFGYAVTGLLDPARVLSNAGARAGDRILLTKPIGTGLITTALKKGKAADSHVNEAVDVMSRTHANAASVLEGFPVHAMTDVTGFGLIGHTAEVAKASGVRVVLEESRVPLLAGALQYSAAGFCSGGLESNREFFGPWVRFRRELPRERENLLFDPQTAGGLLVFVGDDVVEELRAALEGVGVKASIVGVVEEAKAPGIVVQ